MNDFADKTWKIDEEKGKEAITFFQLLYYNKESNKSIILCKPVTGR
jgi:23S rRNA-/tRNA-specific pseudouridylate synthase